MSSEQDIDLKPVLKSQPVIDLDFDISSDDNSHDFLQSAQRQQAAMAQIVNEQQSKMTDNAFHGSTSNPNESHANYINTLISANNEPELTPEASLVEVGRNDVTQVEEPESELSTHIQYDNIEYKPNENLPSIKPNFIKQYYIRFVTNICKNLITNSTLESVYHAQSKMYHDKYIVLAQNLTNDEIHDLKSNIAASIFNEVGRYDYDGETRMVHWQIPVISSMQINDKALVPVTQHDVILPIYDDLFILCVNRSSADLLLTLYQSVYMQLPSATKEYSKDFDPQHNPQYVKKITSLHQSINFLKTNSWYLFTSKINGLFCNKRKKPLSSARGYLIALANYYNNEGVIFDQTLPKKLTERIDTLRYWAEKSENSYLNMTSTQPHLSKRYAHHSISSHQLSYEVLSMLSKPIIKVEPIDNLNYDTSEGILYLSGMNEVMSFWVNALATIEESRSIDSNNVCDSVLRVAAKKARTFYPPSALYLED